MFSICFNSSTKPFTKWFYNLWVKKVIFPRHNRIEVIMVILLGKLHLIKKTKNKGENDFASIDFDFNCAKTTTII